MTPEQINEAVAKKLGWTDICNRHEIGYGIKWVGNNPRKKRNNIPDGYRAFDSLPDFCRSIEAAWELVDNWNECGDFYLRRETIQKKINWQASFWFNGENKAAEWADTAPMAIALAFLKLP